MTAATEMAMFPLQSVLLPAAPLRLHVFEERYRALMRDVMEAAVPEFGVVLIERGSEVGGGDVRSRVGTVARVVDAQRAPDGRWGVVCLGARRIDVYDWLPDDPYPRAMVSDRADRSWSADAEDALARAEPVVRRALALQAELGDAAPPATVELAELGITRSWQLIAVAPIPTLDRHELLCLDDPAARLRRLAALVEEALEVLGHRLRGL